MTTKIAAIPNPQGYKVYPIEPETRGYFFASIPELEEMIGKPKGFDMSGLAKAAGTVPSYEAQVIDLSKAPYKLSPKLSKTKVKQRYPTVAEAKAAPELKDFFPAMLRDGYTEAQCMEVTCAAAFWVNALWTNVSHVAIPGERGLCLSTNRILCPMGPYWINITLERAHGYYEGHSTFTSDPSGAGGTEFLMWHEEWIGKPEADGKTFGMGDFARGSNSFYAYTEGIQCRNFRINGRAGDWKQPGRRIVCLQSWDSGEGSEQTNMFLTHGDRGLEIVRGTPFTSGGVISCFSNNEAGIAIVGGAGASINLNTISCDDNPTIFLVEAGYGRQAGCSLRTSFIKSEWAITPPSSRVWKRQLIMIGSGWIRFKCDMISHALGNVFQDVLFDLDCNLNTSKIQVDDIRLFGADNLQGLLHDRVNNVMHKFDVGWTSEIQAFRWSSCRGGIMDSWPMPCQTVLAPHNNVLGYLPGDPATARPIGVFDRVAGTPPWSDETGNGTAPPTNPPVLTTIILSVPSLTVGTPSTITAAGKDQYGSPMAITGTWSVTGAATITAGGVLTPTATTPLTIKFTSGTVVGTATAQASAPLTAAFTLTNLNTSVTTKIVVPAQLNGKPVKSMVMKGVRFGDTSFGYINSNVTVYNGNIHRLQSPAVITPVVAATRYERIDVPMDNQVLTHVFGGPNGNSAVMTVDSIEFYI